MSDRHKSIALVISLAILFSTIFVSAISATVSFDTGVQPQAKLAEVKSVFSYSSAEPGKTYPAAVIVDISKGWHINSNHPQQDYLIPAKLEIDTVPGLLPRDIVYPKPSMVELIGEQMSVFDGKIIIHFDVDVSDNAQEGQIVIPVRFTYQACNDRECRAPQTENADLNINIGAEGEAILLEIFDQSGGDKIIIEDVPESQSQPENPVQESDLERLIREYGFWGYFLALGLAYITGVLLSFSPCTYPMIPITVSVFAGQDRSIGRGFMLSLFYVGSMAVVYGIMGLIVSLVGGVFGAWLANPAVVIGIAIIFVIFSLSMFGLYELQVPASLRNKLGTRQAGSGIGGSIVLGIIAALVVSPCVGPFVAGILLYIATYGSPIVGFLVLFVFAIGLGTLYLIIGTFSSAISALPGAGMWMEAVKKFFGFILLLMALYFLRTIISPTLYAVLMGLLLIVFSVFGGGFDRLTPEDKFFSRLKKLLGLIAFIVGVYLLISTMLSQGFMMPRLGNYLAVGENTSAIDNSPHISWNHDLESGLTKAQNEKKPILIDTWATWCANCRVLEKKTFGHPDVVTEAGRFVPLKVQLETADSEITKNFMKRFGLKHYSLPTVILIDSKGNIKRILQGVVDPEDMIDEMQKIK